MNDSGKGDVDKELAVIEEELRKREKRLAVLVEEIRRSALELAEYSVSSPIREGDIGKMKSIEAHRRSLREVLKKKEAQKVEAELDVKRARERKAMLLEERANTR